MNLTELERALDAGVPEMADEKTIKDLVEAAFTSRKEPSLQQRLSGLLTKLEPKSERAQTVLAAGVLGVLPALESLGCYDANELQINPFLHKVRKAMLGLPGGALERKTLARTYVFYPEFLKAGGDTVRERAKRIALAHVKTNKKSETLTVLYSLGGYFDWKQASSWAGIGGGGGTTCLMTARGVYHAAGANIIGSREPTVNVPGGMFVELGRHPPFANDDQNQPPHLREGDIYHVTGEGQNLYLARLGSAAANHVGIVVRSAHPSYDTVDGGQDAGDTTDIKRDRKTVWTKLGWSFTGAGSAYSTAEITKIYEEADAKEGGKVKAATIKLEALRKEKAPANEILAAKKEVEVAQAGLKGAVFLIKQKFGEQRTISGWWTPEQYPALKEVTSSVMRHLLAKP